MSKFELLGWIIGGAIAVVVAEVLQTDFVGGMIVGVIGGASGIILGGRLSK